MWHVFICEVYSEARRVRQKIWTPLKDVFYPVTALGLISKGSTRI